MYNLIRSSNNSLTLEIAVPGLRKDELEAKVENGVLTISSNRRIGVKEDYVINRIRPFTSESFTLGPDMKVDLVTYDSGILRVLMSKRMEVGSRIDIQ